MFRRRGENYHSTYILLGLQVTFFLFHQLDPARFLNAFAFFREAVAAGQVWRLFTYQFEQGGSFFFINSPAIGLFFSMLFTFVAGNPIEEEWGTNNFIALFVISSLTTAGVAALLHVPLMGAYFVSYTLLVIFGAMYPDHSFYVMYILPVPAKILALLALGLLVIGIFSGSPDSLPALAGVAASYAFYRIARALPAPVPAFVRQAEKRSDTSLHTSTRNIARYTAIKNALATKSDADIDRLIAQSEKEIVRGVNICPPADYKPDNADGYCVRCDGFAECSARYLRLNRVKTETA